MSRETGGYSPEKEKSPEELEFDELTEDAGKRSLEANAAFAETEEDMARERKESMRGAYWESGDLKKMAVYKLKEVQGDLRSILSFFKISETAGNKEAKKLWEKGRDERMERIQPMLSELGLAVPKTKDEARDLSQNIASFENFQKMVKILQTQAKE